MNNGVNPETLAAANAIGQQMAAQAAQAAPEKGAFGQVGDAFVSGLKVGAWVGGVVLAVGIPYAIVTHLRAGE